MNPGPCDAFQIHIILELHRPKNTTYWMPTVVAVCCIIIGKIKCLEGVGGQFDLKNVTMVTLCFSNIHCGVKARRDSKFSTKPGTAACVP